MAETEHPERERLAHILCNAASAWWSDEELNSPMTELEQRHWAAWSNAVLALLRPEAASPPEGREPEALSPLRQALARKKEQLAVDQMKRGNPRDVAPVDRGPRELLCMICGREHPTWSAASVLWNRVVRWDGADEWPFLCPTCFIVKARERGVDAHFELRTDDGACEAPLRNRICELEDQLRAPAAPVDRGLVERLRGRAEWIDRKLPFTSLVFVELRRDFMTANADDLREAANVLERAPEPLPEPIVRWGDHEFRDGQWRPPLERAPVTEV